MAPKKEDHDLGRVKSHAEGWRVVVKLAGTLHCGPRRNVRSCAEDDLLAMRAVPRTEMAAHLAQLKTIAAQARSDAAADAASVPSAPIPSSPAASTRPQRAEPAFLPAAERTIADNVGGGVDAWGQGWTHSFALLEISAPLAQRPSVEESKIFKGPPCAAPAKRLRRERLHEADIDAQRNMHPVSVLQADLGADWPAELLWISFFFSPADPDYSC